MLNSNHNGMGPWAKCKHWKYMKWAALSSGVVFELHFLILNSNFDSESGASFRGCSLFVGCIHTFANMASMQRFINSVSTLLHSQPCSARFFSKSTPYVGKIFLYFPPLDFIIHIIRFLASPRWFRYYSSWLLNGFHRTWDYGFLFLLQFSVGIKFNLWGHTCNY